MLVCLWDENCACILVPSKVERGEQKIGRAEKCEKEIYVEGERTSETGRGKIWNMPLSNLSTHEKTSTSDIVPLQ